MAPTDARKKIDQKRKNRIKGRRKPGTKSAGIKKKPTPAKIKDLREVLVKTKRNKTNKVNKRKSLTSKRGVRGQQPSSYNKQPTNSRGKSSGGSNARRNNNNNQQQHATQPTYIISQAPPHHGLAMDGVEHQSASVLISNLLPTITQSDIIELFGDVGSMTAVNMINQTTALVTYQHSGDAVRAVKVYHNRLLDGKPMMVNMMPIPPASTTNIRQRVGQSSVVGLPHGNSINTNYTPRR